MSPTSITLTLVDLLSVDKLERSDPGHERNRESAIRLPSSMTPIKFEVTTRSAPKFLSDRDHRRWDFPFRVHYLADHPSFVFSNPMAGGLNTGTPP